MSEVNSQRERTGGRILVDALLVNGTDTVYCVPGESYLPVLDALHDSTEISTYATRHEGAAANMADAYGKLTGRPGICIVTRGPGAMHASIGVHTAQQDSTPMILFIGQVSTGFIGREAFQEVDYRKMFASSAKWVTEIDDISRIPEIISRAFSCATSGRPGPVVISLPEDVLFASAQVADLPVARTAQAAPAPADIDQLQALLGEARRPLMVLGGTGWNAQACAQVQAFAQRYDLPVAVSFRRQDLFDNCQRNYVGQIGLGLSAALLETVRAADLVLAVGTRLSEVSSNGYTLFAEPGGRQKLAHVHPDPNELGRVYHPVLAINSGTAHFATALAELPAIDAPWSSWTQTARAAYMAHSSVPASAMVPAGVDLSRVVLHLNEVLPEDAIVANGAGNYTVWVHRFFRYRRPATELAPTSGAMGYGLPAAIAAKLAAPQRTVVCFAGDGCFMMYPQELATAMQYGAAVIVLLVNNGMLGTIRMHQEREFPGRISSTTLANPDFVAFAKSFGAYAERIERSEDFPAAFARAQASGLPAVLDLRTDPLQITPSARLA